MKIYFSAGINEQSSPNLFEAAKGSYNFALSKDSYKLKPRTPFDLTGTVTNVSSIGGFLQLITRSDAETTLVQAAADVYKWSGGSTFSSVGTCSTSSRLRDCYWSLDDYLVITDLEKATAVSTWDGTTFGTLTTGLAGTLYAKYAISHRNRVWLFNLTEGATDLSHVIAASQFEDPTSYDTTIAIGSGTLSVGTEAFYMTTPDLKPINGAVLFQDSLLISTEGGRLYVLTGNDSTDYAFVDFYVKSNAIGDESLALIGNDVVYMRTGGNIESLTSTQKYGDVSADDLSRWIPKSVKNLTSAITVYDQSNQIVYFFVTNKVLVLYKDLLYGGVLLNEKGERAKLSPWSVFTTQDSSYFNATTAKYMRVPGADNYTVYWGDSTGRILDMNGVGAVGDAGGKKVQVMRISRFIEPSDGINFIAHVTRGIVQYRRVAPVDLYIEFDWSDSYNTELVKIPLKGPPYQDQVFWNSGPDTLDGDGYWGGDYYWSQGFLFADKVSHQNFSAPGKGPGVTISAYTEDALIYEVDHIELK